MIAIYKIAIVGTNQVAGNQAAIALTGNPADVSTFSIPLSATGDFPATHWGCCSAADEPMRMAMAQLNQGLGFEFAAATLDGEIVNASLSELMGLSDAWGSLLSALGLQVCTNEILSQDEIDLLTYLRAMPSSYSGLNLSRRSLLSRLLEFKPRSLRHWVLVLDAEGIQEIDYYNLNSDVDISIIYNNSADEWVLPLLYRAEMSYSDLMDLFNRLLIKEWVR